MVVLFGLIDAGFLLVVVVEVMVMVMVMVWWNYFWKVPWWIGVIIIKIESDRLVRIEN